MEKPDMSGDFVPWFEKYLRHHVNPNLAQADFMAKLECSMLSSSK